MEEWERREAGGRGESWIEREDRGGARGMGLVLIGDMGRWGLEMGKREDGGWCIWGVCESEAVQHGCGLRRLCEKIGCGCGCGRESN